MDRLERLVNLVAALIDTSQPLTRAEIRQRIDGYSQRQRQPSGATSSGTRSCCGRWGSRW